MTATRTYILFFAFLCIGLGTSSDPCHVTSIQVETVKNGTGLSSERVHELLLQRNITFGDPASHLLSCVDGRALEGIIATPGGDSGEVLLALTIYCNNGGDCDSEEEIMILFRGIMELVEPDRMLYMHTDEHALERLEEEAARIYPGFTDITDIPPEYQEELFDVVINSSYIGCGHLRLVLENPDQYQTPTLVTAAYIKSFFDFMWNHVNWTKLNFKFENSFEVLQGNHVEQAVVNIIPVWPAPGVCSSMVPLITPNTSFFVNHPSSVGSFRNLLATYFAEELEISAAEFRAQMDELGTAQIGFTISHLAADQPIYNVRMTVEPTDNTLPISGSSLSSPVLLAIYALVALLGAL